MHRCGTANPEETVALARRLAEGPVRYRGIMGYEGHAVLIPDPAKRKAKARAALERLSLTRACPARRRPAARTIVSAGGTGTYDITGAWPASPRSRPAPTSSWTAATARCAPTSAVRR